MDLCGFALFAIGLILYFALKRQSFFLFVSGIGAGLVIGAFWAMAVVNSVLK